MRFVWYVYGQTKSRDGPKTWAGNVNRGSGRVIVEGERAHAAGQVAVGIGKGLHRRKRLPDREGLVVGSRVPLVSGDAAVEDAAGGSNRHPAVAPGVPRNTEARGDVVLVGFDDAAADAGVAGEEQAFRRVRRHLGLRAWDERKLAVLGVRERRLHVISDAEVQRDSRMDPEIVLGEQAVVRPVVELSHWRVLCHRGGEPQQKVRVGIPSLAGVEEKDTVVVEQRVVNDLLVRNLPSYLERVVSSAMLTLSLTDK